MQAGRLHHDKTEVRHSPLEFRLQGRDTLIGCSDGSNFYGKLMAEQAGTTALRMGLQPDWWSSQGRDRLH